MRLQRIHVQSDTIGLNVSLDWAPALVIFGPNDVGKSSLLRALQSRSAPGGRGEKQPSAFSVLWELDEPDVAVADVPDRLRELSAPFNLREAWESVPGPIVWSVREMLRAMFDPNEFGEEASADELKAAIFPPLKKFRDTFAVLSELSTQAAGAPEEMAPHCERLTESLLASRIVGRFGTPCSWVHPQLSGAHWLFARRRDWSAELRTTVDFIVDQERWRDRRGPVFVQNLREIVNAESDDIYLAWHPLSFFNASSFTTTRMTDAYSPKRIQDRLMEFFARALGDSLAMFRPPPHLYREEGGQLVLDERIPPLLRQVAAQASAIAPTFVSDSYSFSLEAASPGDRLLRDSDPIRILLVSKPHGSRVPLQMVGSGIRLWASWALEEAMRTLEAESAGGSAISYVFDEPEQHLHPEAQRQAAEWIAQRVAKGANVLLATHSVSFLDLPIQSVKYYRMFRTDGQSDAVDITTDVIPHLREHAHEAGISPAVLVQVMRGLLMVEGEQDKDIIRWFEPELVENRVEIAPLRGALEAAAIAEMEFIDSLGKPVFVLLDRISEGFVRAWNARDELSPSSHEERQLMKLAQSLSAHQDIRLLVFDLPDIMAALPDDHTRSVVEEMGGRFTSWSNIVTDYEERAPGRSFKKFALGEMGLNPQDDEQLIRRILALPYEGQIAHQLRNAIQQVLAETSW